MISEVDNYFDIFNIEKLFPHYFKKDSLKQQLDNNSFRKIYQLKEDDEIIGILIIDIIYERMELIEIEVIKNKRNNGYGDKLVKFILDLGEKLNLENITLEVRVDNITAISLYEKNGFKRVAVRENYYRGTDGILMERKMM